MTILSLQQNMQNYMQYLSYALHQKFVKKAIFDTFSLFQSTNMDVMWLLGIALIILMSILWLIQQLTFM